MCAHCYKQAYYTWRSETNTLGKGANREFRATKIRGCAADIAASRLAHVHPARVYAALASVVQASMPVPTSPSGIHAGPPPLFAPLPFCPNPFQPERRRKRQGHTVP